MREPAGEIRAALRVSGINCRPTGQKSLGWHRAPVILEWTELRVQISQITGSQGQVTIGGLAK